jgi:hypothetical protein
MGKDGFRELKVWQESNDLAVYIYCVTNSGSFSKDFGLRDQIVEQQFQFQGILLRGMKEIQIKIRSDFFIGPKAHLVK